MEPVDNQLSAASIECGEAKQRPVRTRDIALRLCRTEKDMVGFSLVELLITIAIAAIVVSLGVPSFLSLLKNSRLAGQANDLVATFNTARSEAVTRSTRITVCKSSTGASCSGDWEDGWIIFADPANAGTVDAGEEIIMVNDGLDHSGFSLRGNGAVASRVSFTEQGYSDGFAGQLALCFDYDNDGSGDFDDKHAWVFDIAHTGRVRKVRPSDAVVSIASCTP